MNSNVYLTIITILGSVVTGGGLLKLLQWRTDDKKTVADGWQSYAKDLETRMDRIETKYEQQIKSLEDLLVAKNKEISDLQLQVSKQDDEIRLLRHQVRDMQQVQMVQGENKKAGVEQAKSELHQSVEDNLNQL